MSQNCLLTDSVLGPVRVRAGWDAPLEELFCNVELLGGDLSLSTATPACFHEFIYSDVFSMLRALAEGGIKIPQSMVEAIESDLVDKRGNLVRDFGKL